MSLCSAPRGSAAPSRLSALLLHSERHAGRAALSSVRGELQASKLQLAWERQDPTQPLPRARLPKGGPAGKPESTQGPVLGAKWPLFRVRTGLICFVHLVTTWCFLMKIPTWPRCQLKQKHLGKSLNPTLINSHLGNYQRSATSVILKLLQGVIRRIEYPQLKRRLWVEAGQSVRKSPAWSHPCGARPARKGTLGCRLQAAEGGYTLLCRTNGSWKGASLGCKLCTFLAPRKGGKEEARESLGGPSHGENRKPETGLGGANQTPTAV